MFNNKRILKQTMTQSWIWNMAYVFEHRFGMWNTMK